MKTDDKKVKKVTFIISLTVNDRSLIEKELMERGETFAQMFERLSKEAGYNDMHCEDLTEERYQQLMEGLDGSEETIN